MQPSQNENGFQGQGQKNQESRAKIKYEQHRPMLQKREEGNVNKLSFQLRVKRKEEEIR